VDALTDRMGVGLDTRVVVLRQRWADTKPPALGGRTAQVETPPSRASRHDNESSLAILQRLTWEDYRAVIAALFRREGYDVVTEKGPDADVIDLLISRGQVRMVVNCRLRQASPTDSTAVLDMAAAARRYRVDGAFLISDGVFTPDAWASASRRGVTLIDRLMLLAMITERLPEVNTKTHPSIQLRAPFGLGRKRSLRHYLLIPGKPA
jgi:hypothetical protein